MTEMSRILNKYIIALDYAGKTFLAFSGAGSRVSFYSFTTAIWTLAGMACFSIILMRNKIALDLKKAPERKTITWMTLKRMH